MSSRFFWPILCIVALTFVAEPVRADEAPVVDPAWQLYDQAFVRLAEGDAGAARALLEELRSTFPEHPAAIEAGRRLEAMAGSEPVDDEPVDLVRGERRSKLSRGELVFSMTGHGLLSGMLICGMLDCSGARAVAASLMFGGGGGLAGSLYLTRDGITPGQAQLYSAAVSWGLWNSLMINDGVGTEPSEYAVHFASQAGGLLLGYGLDRLWAPTSGEVSLANSGGFWTVVTTLLIYGMADKEPDFPEIVLAGDAGIVLGGLLATELPAISRGRSLLMDVGGVLGFLGGALVAAIAESDNEVAVFAPMLVGTTAGLGVATYATRDWDAPAPGNARLAITPMGTRGWGALMSFDWD